MKGMQCEQGGKVPKLLLLVELNLGGAEGTTGIIFGEKWCVCSGLATQAKWGFQWAQMHVQEMPVEAHVRHNRMVVPFPGSPLCPTSWRRFILCILWTVAWTCTSKLHSGGKSACSALSLIKRKVLDYGSLGHISSVRSYLSSEQNQSPISSLSSQCHASEAARLSNDGKVEGSSTGLKEGKLILQDENR